MSWIECAAWFYLGVASCYLAIWEYRRRRQWAALKVEAEEADRQRFMLQAARSDWIARKRYSMKQRKLKPRPRDERF